MSHLMNSSMGFLAIASLGWMLGCGGNVSNAKKTDDLQWAEREAETPADLIPEVSIPETGIYTSTTGLIKRVETCPGEASLKAEKQTCTASESSLPRPNRNSKVTVHYTGWTMNGKQFDSSVDRGKPSSFGLTQVIAGWTEGVQTMVVGEKARFWIPEDLAYKGKPGKPAGMLVFDIELISID